jgi:predicted transcriptional regulator
MDSILKALVSGLTMTRKPSSQLTEAELRLMRIVWQKGRVTVSQVAAALPKNFDLAYNTVLTTMRILESKGYIQHAKEKDGRAFVYSPVVGRLEATRNAVRQLLRRFFSDSPKELVLNLLDDETLGDAELRKIRKLLKQRKGGQK